jgi:hypothetical protein
MATIKNDTVSAKRLQGLNEYPRYFPLIYVTYKPFATRFVPSPLLAFSRLSKGEDKTNINVQFK